MKYKVTRLDGRHTGSDKFKFYVTPIAKATNPERREAFYEWRVWSWAQWGPSSERDWTEPEAVWAWDTEYNHLRLYLKTDKEMSIFHFKWAW